MKPLNPADEFSTDDTVRWAYLKATDPGRTARFYARLVTEPWATQFSALADTRENRPGGRRERMLVFSLIDKWRTETERGRS